ncbi:MAG: glycosyltransferase family 2 protein, partial [Chloroflexota bacterium]
RREMLDQVGLLDERFFFSAEDVDIGWRAQLMGWKCVYSPQAVVYHKLQATGGGSIASYHNGRNFIFLIVKNYPWSLLRKNLGAVIGAQWNISVEAVRAFRGKAARARLKGQLVGLLYIPLMLKSRWQIMSQRTVSDKELLLVLTPVDEVL